MIEPSTFIDSDHPSVMEFARRHAGEGGSPRERAVRLYYAVRDGFRYNPYLIDLSPDSFKASYVLTQKESYCIPKAVLLAAAARAIGVPARLGFSDVRNHIGTEKLSQHLKTDVMVFHGYTDLYLEGQWVKATPAFNVELCEKLQVAPLEFDGTQDSMLQEYDKSGDKYMEYLRHYGTFDDMPVERFVAALKEGYPHFFDNG